MPCWFNAEAELVLFVSVTLLVVAVAILTVAMLTVASGDETRVELALAGLLILLF